MDEVGPFQNEGVVLDPMTCITETFLRARLTQYPDRCDRNSVTHLPAAASGRPSSLQFANPPVGDVTLCRIPTLEPDWLFSTCGSRAFRFPPSSFSGEVALLVPGSPEQSISLDHLVVAVGRTDRF